MKNQKIKHYLEKHLAKDEPLKVHSTEHISAITYEKGQKTVEKLFNDFESVNIREVSQVVDDLSGMIIDNNTTFKSLSKIMSHDYHTHTHSINVGIYAMYFGRYKKLHRNDVEKLWLSGLMHDRGMIEVEKEIINKNTKLSTEELEEITAHPEAGHNIALSLGINDAEILSAIKFHHEKIDGSGYPMGLKNQEIPYFAKIVTICDIFDALTSERSYKSAVNSFEALRLMKNDSLFNGKIDSEILSTFIQMLGARH